LKHLTLSLLHINCDALEFYAGAKRIMTRSVGGYSHRRGTFSCYKTEGSS